MFNSQWSWLIIVVVALWSGTVMAQTTVTGTVTDAATGETLIGANVLVVGTMQGTITDIDGNYTIEVPEGKNQLRFSFTGYKPEVVDVNGRTQIDVALQSGKALDEVVVIGYGTTQTKDLTGSVVAISEEDFLQGNISTPDQLVAGKIAGVKITSNGGAPGSGSQIRIRGGTSINASNDPLIVIDGVPVDNTGIAGSANALNLINPNEIETMTVLKDASAAAIYGSRAANGVILITTKGGEASKELRINFSTNNAFSQNINQVDVLSGDELRQVVNDVGEQRQIDLLGNENTDWQDVIYRTGFSTQNNLSFMGGIKNLPYRLNLEFFNDQGVLKRSEMSRYSANLNLSPTYLDGRLKFDVNGKYSYTNNFFADQGAIGAAVTFDPTQPVYSESDEYGGYFEWLSANGQPNFIAPRNPLGLLMQRDDESNVHRFIGNVKVDYQTQFLPDLTLTMNAGTDISRSSGYVFVPETAASAFDRQGIDNVYEQSKDNRLFEFYGNYKKDLESIDSRLDVTAGYSYQNWLTKSPAQADINAVGDTIRLPGVPFETENTLISFYGRVNYNLKERYLITATLRNDGSSRFSPDTRWGLFPSVALAWRLSEEQFMANSGVYVKLRAGWGITGQQDIGNDYPYIPNYQTSTPTAQYQFGNEFYTFLRPDGYDANIKWEETYSYNFGVDLGFMNNALNATIDFYHKVTEDLLAVVPVPAGTNFTNQILTNVGGMTNTGLEVTLNYIAIDKEDLRLDVGINGTFNVNEITRLTKTQDPTDPGINVGGIPGGIGNTVQVHTVGYPAFSYLVYQQKYDDSGNPIEDEYEDLNGDGEITPGRADLGLGDQYVFDGNPAPDVFAGFYGNLTYKDWSLGFSLRGEFGAYIYNGVAAQRGFFQAVDGARGYLNNLTSAYFASNFMDGDVTQFLSDYYLEKANFVRMDNLSLGYNFGNVFNSDVRLQVNAVVQNVFVISNYSGLDPEVVGGIDNNIYPRPRIYSLNLNISL